MAGLLSMYRYSFDPTGVAESNLISSEEVSYTTDSSYPFVLREGLFFTESIVVVDKSTDRTLESSEYGFVSIDPYVTASLGKEVAAGVQLTSTSFVGTLQVTYQCVGGPEGKSNSILLDLIDKLEELSEDSTISWTSVTDKPEQYPPEVHEHPLSELTELEELRQALDDVANALVERKPLVDSPVSYQAQLDRVTRVQAYMQNALSKLALYRGSTEALDQLREDISNQSTIMAYTDNLVLDTQKTIGTWADTENNVARGSLIFISDDGDVESFDFGMLWTEDTDPVVLTSGHLRTGDALLSLSAESIDDNIELYATATVDGAIKVKWYACY